MPVSWGLCRNPLLGYDLAHWQGTAIQWGAARELGIVWAVAKRWHGRSPLSTDDPQLTTARAAGVEMLGGYAWALPDEDLDLQVGAWVGPGERRAADEFPLTIDWEHANTQTRGGKLVARLEYLIERVSDRLGARPIIYTGEWYWQGFCGALDSEIAASCPLWLAAYPRKNATGVRYREAVAEVCGGVAPAVPRPWRDRGIAPIAWQFDGDRGLYLPGGIDCDVNIADGDALRALLPRRDTLPAAAPVPSVDTVTAPQTPHAREHLSDLSLDTAATPLRAGEGEHVPAHLRSDEDPNE